MNGTQYRSLFFNPALSTSDTHTILYPIFVFRLSPNCPLNLEIVEKEMDNVDFEARMKELMGEFTTLTDEAHRLEKKIKDDWGKIL